MSITKDPDNPEWTEADFKQAKPASQLPPEVVAAFPRTRGPQKTTKKVPISIRLSAEVIDYFKSQGPGWQARIDDELKSLVAERERT